MPHFTFDIKEKKNSEKRMHFKYNDNDDRKKKCNSQRHINKNLNKIS